MRGSHVHSLELAPAVSHAPLVPGSTKGHIRTILLATDLSPTSEGAADEAISLCETLAARLLVVNVIDTRRLALPFRPDSRAVRIDQVRAERESSLMAVVARAHRRGVEGSFLVWRGEPGSSIVAAAEAEQADMIVVGTRALDRAGRFLLGSVSDYVVNHSTCPVLIAR